MGSPVGEAMGCGDGAGVATTVAVVVAVGTRAASSSWKTATVIIMPSVQHIVTPSEMAMPQIHQLRFLG